MVQPYFDGGGSDEKSDGPHPSTKIMCPGSAPRTTEKREARVACIVAVATRPRRGKCAVG